MDYTMRQMILQGWPVLSVLWVMSILSVTVLVDRLIVLKRARCDARGFVLRIVEMIERQGVSRAVEFCRTLTKPIAAVTAEVLLAEGGREARQRVAEHAIQCKIKEMEAYVSILGTVASTAPFVGLFGTVLGIMKAFRDISMHLDGGANVVAAGISEALITTAFGLLVAIPATMAYNYLARQIQNVADDIDLAVFDLIEKKIGEKEPGQHEWKSVRPVTGAAV